MTAKINLKILLPVSLLVLLAGCQVFTGISSSAPTPSALLPLSGPQASKAGASALMVYQNPTSIGVLLVPVNVSTGQPENGFAPVDFGSNEEHVFSADRGLLAFASTNTAACQAKCLHVLDVRAWKETILPVKLSGNNTIWAVLAFNSQNTVVAVALNNPGDPGASGGQLLLVDLSQNRIIQQMQFSANVEQMGFTPSGSLAVYGSLPPAAGQESKMNVALYDGSSLQTLWSQDLDEISYGNEFGVESSDPSQGRFLSPAAVFSHDHARLYVVAADKPVLVSVDFASQTVQSTDIHPRQGFLERLLTAGVGVAYAKAMNGAIKTGALSPDGKTMYIVGQTYTAVKDQAGGWTSQVASLGLLVVDLSDGTEAGTLATEATDVHLSLDGKTILLTGYGQSNSGSSQPWTYLADAATLKVTRRLGSEIVPSRLLNGSQALLSLIWADSGPNHLAIYDPTLLNLLSQHEGTTQDYAAWVPIP